MPASRRTLVLIAIAAVLSALPVSSARAQQPAAAASTGPALNDLAPDFALKGATRYGLLATPVRLSDYRGSTVVLAFFFQARTKG